MAAQGAWGQQCESACRVVRACVRACVRWRVSAVLVAALCRCCGCLLRPADPRSLPGGLPPPVRARSYHCNMNVLLGKARTVGQVKWADMAVVRAELDKQVSEGVVALRVACSCLRG